MIGLFSFDVDRLPVLWIWFQEIKNNRYNWIIEDVTSIPEDWNAFWEEVRSRSDFLLSRESEYLKWRYFDNPRAAIC